MLEIIKWKTGALSLQTHAACAAPAKRKEGAWTLHHGMLWCTVLQSVGFLVPHSLWEQWEIQVCLGHWSVFTYSAASKQSFSRLFGACPVICSIADGWNWVCVQVRAASLPFLFAGWFHSSTFVCGSLLVLWVSSGLCPTVVLVPTKVFLNRAEPWPGSQHRCCIGGLDAANLVLRAK